MNAPTPSANQMQTLAQLGALNRSLTEQYLESTRRTLSALVAQPKLLEGVELKRAAGKYVRNLLFGDAQFSVWAIVWSPGSHTSIHDHHCSCCFGVLSGQITELRYQNTQESYVTLSKRAERAAGYVACMLPSGPNIHRMQNDGDEDAISIHIYGYDHQMHQSSIYREYRLLES